MVRRSLPLLLVLPALGCGVAEPGAKPATATAIEARTADARGTEAFGEQDLRPVPIGRHPRFKPGSGAYAGEPVAGLACGPAQADRFGVHVELFAAGRVIVVPAGIGVAGGERDGAFVRGGRCHHPIATTEPTGVIEVLHGTRATLGDLFAVWGEPLTGRRIAGFRGRVRAYVDGKRITGDPTAIRLSHHAQIVLAIGPGVPVRSAFAFKAGM